MCVSASKPRLADCSLLLHAGQLEPLASHAQQMLCCQVCCIAYVASHPDDVVVSSSSPKLASVLHNNAAIIWQIIPIHGYIMSSTGVNLDSVLQGNAAKPGIYPKRPGCVPWGFWDGAS